MTNFVTTTNSNGRILRQTFRTGARAAFYFIGQMASATAACGG
jgi:hypothetical protein